MVQTLHFGKLANIGKAQCLRRATPEAKKGVKAQALAQRVYKEGFSFVEVQYVGETAPRVYKIWVWSRFKPQELIKLYSWHRILLVRRSLKGTFPEARGNFQA